MALRKLLPLDVAKVSRNVLSNVQNRSYHPKVCSRFRYSGTLFLIETNINKHVIYHNLYITSTMRNSRSKLIIATLNAIIINNTKYFCMSLLFTVVFIDFVGNFSWFDFCSFILDSVCTNSLFFIFRWSIIMKIQGMLVRWTRTMRTSVPAWSEHRLVEMLWNCKSRLMKMAKSSMQNSKLLVVAQLLLLVRLQLNGLKEKQ